MGDVYRAWDTQLNRDVALKVGSGDDPDSQSRLRREAQHASQLNHPHICTIHEVGSANGQVYIVMEHVEGSRLCDVLEGLSVDKAVRYGVHIADALAHAHAHGVIHRDLKTANIIITPDERAKVLDFGLARRFTAGEVETLSRSAASIAAEDPQAGTLAYMAPELLRGESADVTTDIWSLGVVLHEMLAGRQPFTGVTWFEVSAAILREDAGRLPDRVPAEMEQIISRCLAKNRRDRYQRAAEVHAALAAWQSGEVRAGSVTNHAPAAKYHLPRVVRSRRALAAAIAAPVILVFALTPWRRSDTTTVAIGASGRPAIAVMNFVAAGAAPGDETAWLSSGVPNMLVTGLAQTRGLEIVGPERLASAAKQMTGGTFESLEKADAVKVARHAGAGAVVVGNIFRSGKEIRIDARLEDLSTGRVLVAESVRGMDLFAMVDELSAKVRTGVGIGTTATFRPVTEISTASLEAYRLYATASEAYFNARWAEAEAMLTEAVAKDPNFAQAYLMLALSSDNHGLPAARRVNVHEAAKHVDRLNERDQLLTQAMLARESGDSPLAASILDQLISRFPDASLNAYALCGLLYEPVAGPLSDPAGYVSRLATAVNTFPTSGGIRNIYAYALMSANRYTDAIHEIETYTRLSPREANPWDSLGEAMLRAGNPLKAIEFYSRALTIDPSFPSHTGRAWTYAVLGRYEEALREAPAARWRGFLLSRVGRYREAEQLIAGATKEARDVENFELEAALHLQLAMLALEREQIARAREALKDARRILAPVPAERRRVYSIAGDLLEGIADVRSGRMEDARAHLRSQASLVKKSVTAENWWHQALAGEIELAAGNPVAARAAFAAGEPADKMWFSMLSTVESVLANNLLNRDGRARAANALGDPAEAIKIYQELLNAGSHQKWVAVYEPRYNLQLGRLLERIGDRPRARREYERCLELWKQADPDLPELNEGRQAVARLAQR
jgi:tetratricopeptide (TPR) repeat protein